MVIGIVALCVAAGARAQTDEIQVYDAAIAKPGELAFTLHSNYIASGRSSAAFAGGLVPDKAMNGVTEWAVGVTPWLELGAYAPAIATLDRNQQVWFDGVKLRALIVAPDAAKRLFFFGCNFELGYSRPHWAPQPWQLEVRPILGVHIGSWDLIANPILDLPLGSTVEFAPSARVVTHLSEAWSVGGELYEEYGPITHPSALTDQLQELFGVVDYSSPAVAVEFGLGIGLTAHGSDALTFKVIVTPFP